MARSLEEWLMIRSERHAHNSVMHRESRPVTGPQRSGGPTKLRRCADSWVEKLGLSAVSNDGAGNCMFEALGQALAKAGKTPTDARTVRTAVVAKMMVQRGKYQACFLWDRWCG